MKLAKIELCGRNCEGFQIRKAMKERVKTSKHLFFFRLGLAFLALLALHVLVTIYKQAIQASEILNELAGSAMIQSSYKGHPADKETSYVSLPEYGEQTYLTERPVKKTERVLRLNSKARKESADDFKAGFQESVFSYERRFYEADQTSRPTYIVEMNRPLREGRRQNSNNIAQANKVRSMQRNGGHESKHRITNSRESVGNETKDNNNADSNNNSNKNNNNNNNCDNNENNNNKHNNNNNKNNSDHKDNNGKGNNNKNNKHNNINNSNNNNNYSNNNNNYNKNNNNSKNNNKNNSNNKTDNNTTNNSNNSNNPNDQKKGKRTQISSGSKVLLIAYHRSGSSFIGEMFNRNPQVFYLFEPIFPVEKIAGRGKYPLLYDMLVGSILDIIYTCSFNKHPFLVDFFSKSAFRLKSMAVKNSTCELNATPKNMSRQCRPLDTTVLEHLCNAKDHIAVKTIRTSSKQTVEHFLGSHTDPNPYTLSLIHLVRDPRAIISSRLYLYIRSTNYSAELKEDRNFTNALRRSVRVASANLCSRIQSDLKYGQRARSDRYMLLRYEDAAMRPLRIYEKISKFTGINESTEVIDWLNRNTKVGKGGEDDYSTSRNSTAAVHGWRNKLPYTLVTEIQNQCYEVLKRLGYLPAATEQNLIDTTKSLVAQL